jgi:alpha-maltose-1-phosphate synthase
MKLSVTTGRQSNADDALKFSIPPKSVVVLAQVLPADARNQILALSDAGVLRKIFTSFAYDPTARIERWAKHVDRVLGTQTSKLLATRPSVDGVVPTDIERSVVPEAIRLLLQSRGHAFCNPTALLDWTSRRLSLLAAKALKKDDCLVVARECEALEVFAAAARKQIGRLYQLPTAHFRTVDSVLRKEFEEYPDLAAEKSHNQSVDPRRVSRKEQELELAETIIVPSQFVKTSLINENINESKIHVLPFGAESEWIADTVPSNTGNIVLHVGQLSIRKGTHRLLKAWKTLRAYRTHELRLIGSMRLSPRFLSDYGGIYNYLGKMPRQSLKQQYMQSCCFVLPALAEGFAVVILEALSCGTPVVVSRNSGAEGFISDGNEGFLHDAQNDEQLCEALEKMLSRPVQRQAMAEQCLLKARSWTWKEYRRAFLAYVQTVVSGG